MVLLADITGEDKAWLLAHPENELTESQLSELQHRLQRRSKHEPLAYIRGKTEFFGHEFLVDQRVMEPRPETEAMLETLLDRHQQLGEAPIIIDVGTGSGALAISAKLALPSATVCGLDVSNDCLLVAQENADRLGADVQFMCSDLLASWDEASPSIAVILANLPYVPDAFPVNQAATYEPKLALFGGADGLELYRRLFAQLEHLPSSAQAVFCESLEKSHTALCEIAAKAGYQLETTAGLIQIFGRIET